ncbi:hypothetical protein [Paeniglutamicibacter psychrophenolicus]|uniref:hypothetical protein n=1 Tax=Paeniglutamicibacter psychrophenolicus TaxID=257454 RepID=UPI002786D550|nr:hypothetical protein [Paeniglutamicibacter psychrophenolicus]MDQ0094812.1 hypothetical protein [Paeniglutamicibacter psychrophenolicus]
MSRIEGRVATVLSDRQIAINRGSQHGVEIGMKFAVLTDEVPVVTDPETGEEIGNVEVAKTLVKIVSIQEKMSIARTFRTKTVGGGSIWSLTGVGSTPKKVEESLRKTESSEVFELDDVERIVDKGDRVVQFAGETFEGVVAHF